MLGRVALGDLLVAAIELFPGSRILSVQGQYNCALGSSASNISTTITRRSFGPHPSQLDINEDDAIQAAVQVVLNIFIIDRFAWK
jgi:hypothetical protein